MEDWVADSVMIDVADSVMVDVADSFLARWKPGFQWMVEFTGMG